MTKSALTVTYEQFLHSEHLALIHKSAKWPVAVPIIFTSMDLAHLFQQSSVSDALKDTEDQINTHKLENLPIDERVKNHFSGSGKETISTISNNALTIAFSLLGYSSSLGRKVECMATEVDDKGQISKDGTKFRGHVSPDFFAQFKSNPMEGAKVLFGQCSNEIDAPDTMMVMAFVSPQPSN